MCRSGSRKGDKYEEWDLDGIGGVSIVVKGDVHKSGKVRICFVVV